MSWLGVVEGKMEEVVGDLQCGLDGRFSSVRTGETNLGNLVTDIMATTLGGDCAILNSGTLRSDTVHPEGKFLLRVRKYSATFLFTPHASPRTC